MPVLSPLGLDPSHPFPKILNKSLNVVVVLEGRDAFGREAHLAIVRAPRSLPRIIRVPDEATERAAVRNVFSAKQAPKPFTGLRLFVGLGVLAALGLGGYFWWQLQSVSVVSLARPMQPQPTAQSMAPACLLYTSRCV